MGNCYSIEHFAEDLYTYRHDTEKGEGLFYWIRPSPLASAVIQNIWSA